jgi:hypothetical protein
MKRIYIVLLILIGISVSCTKNFEDFNTDKKKPTAVPGDFLFANAQKALADQVASANVNLNIWKLISQYWTETTYQDESNYNIVNRTIPDLIFRTYYRDVLEDFKDARASLAADPVAGDDIKIRENKYQIIDLLEVYCYQRLVDIFGNIPYSQALDIENISPAYDDAFTIYKDLIARIDVDIAGLNESYGSFDANDLYFAGDIAMWKKFAYSLKVKLGITLADYDATLAQSTVESAYAGAFAPDERCELVYLGGTNSNPIYIDLVQSGRHDFVAANTIVDIMNTLEDPRRAAYFTTFNDAYVGGPYGYPNTFSQFSTAADPIVAPTFPVTLLDGTEIAFYLAEAAEHGFSVGGDAESHYNAAITSSFNYWGMGDMAAAYLAKSEVAYSTAQGTWQQKIGTQAWLAYYIRGLVGYNSWRRLDFPVLNLPPVAETDDGNVPNRFTYPVNEQTLNAANYYQAAQAIGGDNMTTKLFWDKH